MFLRRMTDKLSNVTSCGGTPDGRGTYFQIRIFCSYWKHSGRHLLNVFVWLSQGVAPAPHSFDVVLTEGSVCELLAQFADKDIDYLGRRFVHPTIQLVEKHFLSERHT